MRKYAKSWESLKKMRKYEKVCRKLRKCAKVAISHWFAVQMFFNAVQSFCEQYKTLLTFFMGEGCKISSDEYKRIQTNIRFSKFGKHIRNFELVRILNYLLFEIRIFSNSNSSIFEFEHWKTNFVKFSTEKLFNLNLKTKN